MSEIKIEPYYRHQGRQLVDCLFDKGLFSGHLSRDSINDVESFLALYLQFSAQTAELTKKYKATDQPRHEEEMRWIARAREAEARVAELEKLLVREEKANAAWKWGREVGVFLLKALRHKPGHSFDLTEGSRLFTAGIALGIIPEPDCRPEKTWEEYASEKGWPGDGCPCPPDPGVLPEICPRCGGRKA